MGNFFRPKNYYILESSEQLMLLEAADFPISSVEKARASFADWFIVYTLSYEQSYRLKSRLFTAEGELLHEAQTADVFWFDLEQELRKLLHEQLQVVLVQPKPSTSSPPKVVQKMFLLRQEEDLRRSWYHLQDEASSFELVDKAQAWFQKAQETQSQLKENYTLLLSEFRTKLDQLNPDYLLTIAAPAGATTVPNMDLPHLADHLDWINIMTYDFHGPWESSTNHHAPLYSNSTQPDANNVDTAVQTYLDSGVPAEKLILGVPFYGKTWSGVSGGDGLFQAATDTGPGNYEDGTMDYHHIVDNYLNNSAYTRYWDDEAMVPYIHSESEGVFITYDDPESMQLKVDFILDKGLGGAMFWELSGDTSTQELGSILANGLLE